MLHLVVVEAGSTHHCTARDFPFTIGRSSTAGLCLQSPGVWDLHASITIRDGRFFLHPERDSLLLINDERFEGGTFRIGDQFSVGGARISVALAPAVQHGLAGREAMIWLFLGAVSLVQILLLLSIH